MGFTGNYVLCIIGLTEDFLQRNPGYFVVPVHISGSAIESVFSCLKYSSGGNLSTINYPTSLSALITQRDIAFNHNGEDGYHKVSLSFK